MTNSVYTPQATKKLFRSRTDKMIAGVAGGWAAYFGIDAAILRIALVASVFFTAGFAIPVYVAAWLLTPEQPGES